jgi:tRNA1Val (adenine37-N6)-methyltransferase
MESLPPDETLETFGENKLRILQKKRGYRFSADAILLSEFVRIRKNEKAIDLGTGCGILPLLLSQTTKGFSFLGIEVQETLSDLAERNVVLNRFQHRITSFTRITGPYHGSSLQVPSTSSSPTLPIGNFFRAV